MLSYEIKSYYYFLNYDYMIFFYKMLKRIQKQRDNDATSSQAHKKRLRESNENSHELSDHEEADDDANSKFSIIICFCYFVLLPNL